jgi:hypothetical protein
MRTESGITDLRNSVEHLQAALAAHGGPCLPSTNVANFESTNAQAAAAALQANLGIAELQAKPAVKAALSVLVNVGLAAAGAPWLAPILQGSA